MTSKNVPIRGSSLYSGFTTIERFNFIDKKLSNLVVFSINMSIFLNTILEKLKTHVYFCIKVSTNV